MCVWEREREREREGAVLSSFFCIEEFQYAIALGFVDVMDALNMHTWFSLFIA